MPLEGTRRDFWKMVKDYNCLTILMLNELDKSEDVRDQEIDNSILYYWLKINIILYDLDLLNDNAVIARHQTQVSSTDYLKQI